MLLRFAATVREYWQSGSTKQYGRPIGDNPVRIKLECVDPWGRTVTLDQDCWEEHILRDHPALSDQLEAIHATLVSPDIVNFDAKQSDGKSYFRRGANSNPSYLHLFVKVCVKYHSNSSHSHGQVLTANVTNAVKAGETEKWRRTS